MTAGRRTICSMSPMATMRLAVLRDLWQQRCRHPGPHCRAESQRDWFRPNPPQPRVKWSLRNNVNMQESAILLAMNFVSNNKDRFLKNFYLKSKRSVAKATNEGPAAWVVPADQARVVEAADMVNLLRLMGVEVHTSDKEISLRDQVSRRILRHSHGSTLLAHGRHAARHSVLQRQRPTTIRRHRLDARRAAQCQNRPRDLGDKGIPQAPMTLVGQGRKGNGKPLPALSPAAYLINHNAENTLDDAALQAQGFQNRGRRGTIRGGGAGNSTPGLSSSSLRITPAN